MSNAKILIATILTALGALGCSPRIQALAQDAGRMDRRSPAVFAEGFVLPRLVL